MSASSRKLAIGSGAALAAIGIITARPTPFDADHDGINQTSLDDDFSSFLPGMLMVGAGMALVVSGLMGQEEPTPSPPLRPLPVGQPQLSTAAPSLVLAPAADAPRETLPELPATAEVLRLAKQVRSATGQGRCDAAWIMWEQIAARDPEYAEALRAGTVMTPCSQ